ncbi:MAG: methionyl-tRNA formyltransferase [Actinomycetota bacterium]|nr:methionyl-tRNA formyltransferase [Actinomycetota bacterium]
MRVVFAGTPAVAVPALRAVLGSAHEVIAVVTRPDAPAGRGRSVRRSPVGAVADELGIPVLMPDRPRDADFREQLTQLAPDVCPVVAYGALIPGSVLQIPRIGWVNLHFSLLPAWRGAAPVQHAIMHGDQVTGATTFLLDEGMDTGPILGTMTQTISDHDTSGALLDRLAEGGGGLLVATLDALAQGELTPTAQPGEGVSLAPKISVEDARVRWHEPAFAVDRRVRGVTPSPGAWTLFRDQRLKLGPVTTVDIDQQGGGTPGVLTVEKSGVQVQTGAGRVLLGSVQPQGRKAMAAADWARGSRIEQGEVFG